MRSPFRSDGPVWATWAVIIAFVVLGITLALCYVPAVPTGHVGLHHIRVVACHYSDLDYLDAAGVLHHLMLSNDVLPACEAWTAADAWNLELMPAGNYYELIQARRDDF